MSPNTVGYLKSIWDPRIVYIKESGKYLAPFLSNNLFCTRPGSNNYKIFILLEGPRQEGEDNPSAQERYDSWRWLNNLFLLLNVRFAVVKLADERTRLFSEVKKKSSSGR
ncbi:hypothetical protein AVEN_273492-1 [Araneus ventricosus]|uniref:Uncharacterized protein n=1 Tax=Araneus ventricosus TaxID=182803 RepID=A0A4Y2SXI3_ARAVE|nr:hypothetical protein AVEN_273492-1 [Araneus ventricosus]